MPLYDFICSDCRSRTEHLFKIAECPDEVPCMACGGISVKVIVPGHGGAFCDSSIDVPWLKSAVEVLQPDHERPIETRGEYNRYLKDRNIIASG